jgi:putative ABC transport system permease protein
MTAISDLGAVLRASFAQHRTRTIVAMLAIALGVALGFAVQLINHSALSELKQGVRTIAGDADLVVRGPRSGFDEAVYARLARDEDVAVASPALEVDVRLADGDASLRILGIDALLASFIQPALVPDPRERLDLLRSDSVFLSPAAQALELVRDDTLVLPAPQGELRLRVAGTVGAARQALGVMDIAGAQLAFQRIGKLSRIDLRLKPGVDAARFRARILPTLPAGVVIDEPEATLRATEALSRSYRVNLNVLALVALFTGGLLVFSTQALAVVRRRSQLALLRVLGVTRRRLAAIVAIEGLLIGTGGAVLGVAAGYAMALAAMRYAGADLGSGFFRGVEPSIDLDASALLAFVLLGVAAAVLGAWAPACEAARAEPARALKAGDEEAALARFRPPARGFGVLALGAILVYLPPIGGLPLGGYAAIACLTLGTLLLLPAIAIAILARLRLPRSAAPALALSQLRGAAGQVTVSLAAIVASVGLMVSMAIMVASFRHSLDAWLDRVLPADLYARTPSPDVALLSDDEQKRIAALPGVARAEFMREEQLLLDASRPRVVLLARTLTEQSAPARIPLVGPAVPRPVAAPPPVWVNEAMVDLYGFTPGRTVSLPIAGREAPFFVAGVWRDYGRPQGAVQIEASHHAALTGDTRASNIAVWLDANGSVANVRAGIASTVGERRLEIAATGEIRALSLAAFDRTFAVTYALELAAVALGLVGLSSAFGALVLARRREFGVLRHLGMTRRQIAAMLATEGFATSVLGVGVGLALGILISLVLIHVVNRQSFHWGMELALPWLRLGGFAFVIVALATLTAVVSGRHAMRADVVQAVKDDW